MDLILLGPDFSVCRLAPMDSIPQWATTGDFYSVTRTDEELSIVCTASQVPPEVRAESGWRCLKVKGPLDFSLTGILASLLNPLRAAKIGVFTISTFDTDYLLLKANHLASAITALEGAGHSVAGN